MRGRALGAEQQFDRLADQVGRHQPDRGRQQRVHEHAAPLAVGGADQSGDGVDHLGQSLAAFAQQLFMGGQAHFQPPLEQVRTLLDLALLRSQFQQVPGAGGEFHMVDRAEQEIRGAGLERGDAELPVAIGGDDDDRDVGIPSPDPPHQLVAGHAGHLVVGDDEIGAVPGQPVQRLLRVGEGVGGDVQAELAGEPGIDLPVGRAVIDDQNCRRRDLRHSALQLTSGYKITGPRHGGSDGHRQ